MADAILKRCPRCMRDKAMSEFYRQGRAGYCIPCEKEYKRENYLANADRIKAKSRQWSALNPERKSATDRAWRNTNQERCAEKSRQWASSNPEKRRAIYTESRRRNLSEYRRREAEYRAKHSAACNARIKEWKQRNPEAIVFYASKRRAAELQALPEWANLDAIAAIYKEAQEMGAGYHVDHRVPLISPMVCGLHCESNLQILTASENAKKNNRWWPDMWEDV